MDTGNSKKTVKHSVEHLKDYQWKPGQSGNPNGRPHNPLKEFSMKEFESWSEYEKKSFLEKISPIDRWRMTEGNPHQTVDSKIDGDISITGVEITVRK